MRSQMDTYDLLPEDLRESIKAIYDNSIKNSEKRLRKLEKYK